MGCSGQNAVGSGAVAVDACKRVNYTLGMLLGVDDFVQETAYHTARRHALAREVLGYGTVRGLDVVVEPDGDRGPRLRVTPGIAWLPSGAPVCVDSEQCCNLNDWLAVRATQVQQALAADSPPADIMLHVVLSYTRCLTDNVIIPGEPCRSEDELMQPSRVTDGFRLELRLSAPPQREEDAVRDFVDWLASIPVVTDSPPLDEESFVEQLRAAAHAWLAPTSPPATPGDFMVGMPPGGLRADEGLLRTALRLWTTELRPLWMARAGCNCGAQPTAGEDDAVLLATLDVPLISTGAGIGWRVSDATDAAVTIDESRRPVLLSLRMVQELITQNPTPEAGDSVVPANAFGLPPAAGTDMAFSRVDHSHGTPELPLLGGDLEGRLEDEPRVVGLRGRELADVKPALWQALLFQPGRPHEGADSGRWAPGAVVRSLPELSGDLEGTLVGSGKDSRPPRVKSLQTWPLNLPTLPRHPSENDLLTFDGREWVAKAAPAVSVPSFGGDLTGAIGSERIRQLQTRTLNAPSPNQDDVLTYDGSSWIAKAATAVSVPAFGGDLAGVIGSERIRQLQTWPLNLPTRPDESPAEDDVLTFKDGQWVAAAATAVSGTFVGRGEGPYEIVAAGEITLRTSNGSPGFAAGPSYGSLAVVDATMSGIDGIVTTLTATVQGARSLAHYIVKLTPMLSDPNLSLPFRPFLRDRVKVAGPNDITFEVLLLGDGQIVEGDFDFRFQVEVSRFGGNF